MIFKLAWRDPLDLAVQRVMGQGVELQIDLLAILNIVDVALVDHQYRFQAPRIAHLAEEHALLEKRPVIFLVQRRAGPGRQLAALDVFLVRRRRGRRRQHGAVAGRLEDQPIAVGLQFLPLLADRFQGLLQLRDGFRTTGDRNGRASGACPA